MWLVYFCALRSQTEISKEEKEKKKRGEKGGLVGIRGKRASSTKDAGGCRLSVSGHDDDDSQCWQTQQGVCLACALVKAVHCQSDCVSISDQSAVDTPRSSIVLKDSRSRSIDGFSRPGPILLHPLLVTTITLNVTVLAGSKVGGWEPIIPPLEKPSLK